MSLRFKDGVRVGRGPSPQLILILIIAETRDIYMDILTRLETLGPEFRVLLEYVGEPREHLHVEYRAMLSS